MRCSCSANGIRVGPVRVGKKGNSRTLAIPAEVVRVADIELGDLYMVEFYPDVELPDNSSVLSQQRQNANP